jgi:hypothetical protein
MRHVIAATAITLLSTMSASLPAQGLPQIPVGTRVRVTAPGLGVEAQVSLFETQRQDTLLMQHGALPLAEVTRLEIYAGRRSRAGIGAVVVGILGFASSYWYLHGMCSYYGGQYDNCTTDPVPLALLGGGLGAVVGAGIGVLFRSDRWEEVRIERVRLQPVATSDGRFGLAASVGF